MTDTTADLQVVPTKLNRPGLDSRWIVRSRLQTALDDALGKKLTLISAPAGYGKTTLVAQWLDHTAVPSVWLSLDRHDGAPDRFLRYLIAAVRQVSTEFGPVLEALCSAVTLPPPDYLAETLIDELAGLDRPLVIVMDDFHQFDSKPVLAVLARLVQYQPENLHLVISTRMDPPLPIATWRVREWLVEIRAAELRFYREEAQSFFAAFPELTLSGNAVEMIFNRTEGWVSGMQLARLSLANAEDPERFAGNFSGTLRTIADFLIEEVVARQPPEIREFLAVTALFDRFCPPLCNQLLSDGPEGSDGREHILKLEQENLFLVPLDSERMWYRYHHLFQTLLKHHMKSELSDTRRARIFSRAGEWFAGQGLIEEALKYFLAAKDMDRAAELIEMNLGGMLELGSSRRTLWRLLGLFPASAPKQQPAIAVALAHSKTFRWDRHGIDELLDAAETALNDPACTIPEPRRDKLLADIHVQRGFHLYWRCDTHGALKHTLQALKYRSVEHFYPHFLAAQYAAFAYAMTGSPDKGLQLMDQAISAGYSTGSPYISAFFFVQAGIHYYAGELAGVEQISKKSLALHNDHAVHRYWSLHTRWLLGCTAYERNQLDLATEHFQRVEQMRYQLSTRVSHDSMLGLALVALAGGEEARAREYADAARGFALESKDPFSMTFSDAFEIRMAMVCHRTPAAVPAMIPPVNGTQSFIETPSLTYAEHLLFKHDPSDRQAGLVYAQNAVGQLRQQHNTRQLIQFMAVHAVALHCTGRPGEALVVLEEVLTMAQPLGFLRTFVDRGKPMAELLALYPDNKPSASYARRILDAFGSKNSETPSLPARHTAPDDQTDHPQATTLSRREREILKMLDTSLANKEIADRLSISPETVKRHIYNIYCKLNVHTRMKAIAAAKNQGLLSEKQTT